MADEQELVYFLVAGGLQSAVRGAFTMNPAVCRHRPGETRGDYIKRLRRLGFPRDMTPLLARSGLTDSHVMILQTIERRAGTKAFAKQPSVRCALEAVKELRRRGLVVAKTPASIHVRLSRRGRDLLREAYALAFPHHVDGEPVTPM